MDLSFSLSTLDFHIFFQFWCHSRPSSPNLPVPLDMTPENPFGNALHQSQHPLQHPYSIHPSDITIPPSIYLHFPACTLAPVAFFPIFLTVDEQTTTWPPLWHPCIGSWGC